MIMADSSKDLIEKLASKFVVLDGPDGCGKSTQLKMLAERFEAEGMELITVRDPGTTAAGEAIREIILSGKYGKLNGECELLLFMAARAQMMTESIGPAIQAGKLVLADRFISASCAYQGAGGVDLKSIIEIGDFAVKAIWPDLTIILDIPPELGFKRINSSKEQADLDAMERRSIDFHQRVRQIFLQIPADYPGPVRIVDADASVQEVHQRIMETLDRVDF